MLDLFQWFYLHKIEGRNPFWKLLELIAESNDYENVNNAQVDEIPDGQKFQKVENDENRFFAITSSKLFKN